MPLNYQALINARFDDVEQTYTNRDAIIYALSLGFGEDPTEEAQLKFVYEREMKVFPTMAGVLGAVGKWTQDLRFGLDWVKILHGEEDLRIFRPLPPEGTVIGRTRIADIIDKGAGRGALILQERDVIHRDTGELLARRTATLFARGDGGCGGSGNTPPAATPVPERAPDIVRDMRIRADMALIYRLNGDYNPVHADPAVARAAGFERPILHGLCTYSIGGRVLVETLAGGDSDRLKRLSARFTSPVYPGETIRTEIWKQDGHAAFRQKVLERDKIVVDFGRAEFA